MNDTIKPNKPSPSHWYTAPFLWTEWYLSFISYSLNKLAIIKLLEIAGKATVLVAIILWFYEAPQRKMKGIRDAWIVINSASGQRGDGGRIDSIEFLAKEGVCLDGISVPMASLDHLQAPNCSIRGANFKGSILTASNFQSANLYEAKFNECILWDVNFKDVYIPFADFTNADLIRADFNHADLGAGVLAGANIEGADFRYVKNIIPSRIKTAKNWQLAFFDDKMRKYLKLPKDYLDIKDISSLPNYFLPFEDSKELDALEKEIFGSNKKEVLLQ